jgi:hypothetical protein
VAEPVSEPAETPAPAPEIMAAVEPAAPVEETESPAWSAPELIHEVEPAVQAEEAEEQVVASAPPAPVSISEAETKEMEQLAREPEAEIEVPGLLVSEIDMSSAPSDVIVDGIEVEEPLDVTPEEQAGLSRVEGLTGSGTFVVGVEKDTGFELSTAPANEFQTPDDSASLMGLASSGSEFQTPDASLELSASPAGGTEFQTPDVTAELAEVWSERQDVEPREPETAPAFTLGTASLALPPEPGSIPPEGLPVTSADLGEPASEEPEPGVVTGPPELFEAEAVGAVEEAVPAVAEAEPPVAETEPPVTETPAPRTSELRLIFPDEAERPEPQKVRRISQEVPAIVIPAASAAEPVVREPEPVMTESMAELYARQGHVTDALKVYRALAAQQPGETRFRDRISELEAAQAPRPRRTGVAAVETGGESVGSFFRSLSSARPGIMGLAAAAAEQGKPAGKGAPTRPASDALSLSAIFGEEPARTQPPPTPEPPSPAATDAFSFDQFFGKPGAETARPSSESGKPSDEDLDQFQAWLKSLKR